MYNKRGVVRENRLYFLSLLSIFSILIIFSLTNINYNYSSSSSIDENIIGEAFRIQASDSAVVRESYVREESIEADSESSFEGFLIIMINLQEEDLSFNLEDFSPVPDLIDIATYYTSFVAFDDQTHHSRIKRAINMIDEAKKYGLKVAVNPGFYPHSILWDKKLSDQQIEILYPGLIGDAKRINGKVYDSTGKIELASSKEHIFSNIYQENIDAWGNYIDYLTKSNSEFISYLINYDKDNTIAYWYGTEEIRDWYNPISGYGIQVKFKELIKNIDPKNRPIISYLPHNYDPVENIPYTTIVKGDDFKFDSLKFKTEENKLLELQRHIILGNYMGLTLGNSGKTNRILSFHNIQKQLSAVEYINSIYQNNNQEAPKHLVFHAPDLTFNGPEYMDQFHARHDFWSGLLDANGVFMYNYAYHNKFPDIWSEYEDGLELIKKGGLRKFIIDGEKSITKVDIITNNALSIILGGWYKDNNPNFDFVIPDYSSINARLFRIDNDGYLIISHSYDQEINFIIDTESSIIDYEIVIGIDDKTSLFNGGKIYDSFPGIDAKVYKIKFSDVVEEDYQVINMPQRYSRISLR